MIQIQKIYFGVYLLATTCFFYPSHSFAQLTNIFKKDSVETDFYVLNDSLVNIRFYVSQKLTSPTIFGKERDNKVQYRSNGNTNLGLGATYGWFTLNIGINFGFINNDDDEKGETRFLDLQTQAIGRASCINLYGQFYRGGYIKPNDDSGPVDGKYVQRPDIYTQQIGASAYYFPNWRRYSHAAAVNQRDWQQKSAGSVLIGGEILTGKIRGDSNIIPSDQLADFAQGKVDRVTFFELGIGAGYAHTFVIKKHFFISASGTISLSGGIQNQFTKEEKTNTGYVRPNYFIQPSVGYNSQKFNASIMLFASRINAGNDEGRYQITTSKLRFTLAYRLLPAEKIKRKMNHILSLNPYWEPEQL